MFPGSEGKVWKFQRGEGGKLWGRFLAYFGKSRGKERGHAANPFRGGGMDISWNHIKYYVSYQVSRILQRTLTHTVLHVFKSCQLL